VSKIEIKITLNNGQRLDKGAASAAFMRYLAQLGVRTDGGKVSSLGSQHKFKARGVTGMDLGTTASATYRTAAEPDGQGELMIQVFSDPGGPAGAAEVAGKLAERLAVAYGLELSAGTGQNEKWAAAVAKFPATGLNGQFREVAAVYTP